MKNEQYNPLEIGIKNILSKYAQNGTDFENFKQKEIQMPIFLPPNACKGVWIVVGDVDGQINTIDSRFIGALRNEKYRKKVRQLDASLKKTGSDPLLKVAYYQFPFGRDNKLPKKELNKAIQLWSAVFCEILDILQPAKIIVCGKKTEKYLIGEIFENVAKEIWRLTDVANGKALREHFVGCDFIGLPQKRPDPKKERNLNELQEIINDMKKSIVNLYNAMSFLEVNIDPKKGFDMLHFLKDCGWNGDDCLGPDEDCTHLFQIVYSPYHALINQWERLKELKYRLENNKNSSRTEDLIEKAEIIKNILDYSAYTDRPFPCIKIKAAIKCIKWLNSKNVHAEDNGFYKLFAWALGEKKYHGKSRKINGINLSEKKQLNKNEKGNEKENLSGIDQLLNRVYKYYVTNVSSINLQYAEEMEMYFVMDDNQPWKPNPELKEKRIFYSQKKDLPARIRGI